MSLGWEALETHQPTDTGDDGLPRLFAECFRGSRGEAALGHLRRTFLLRRLPPQASDAELRHLEGQRAAIAYIIDLIERDKR